MKLKCKDCKKYVNTATEGHGVCSLPNSWFPVESENDCHYLSGAEIKCKDCGRFGADLACITADENDCADDCMLFIDIEEENLHGIFWKWLQRGTYSREKIMELCDEFENSERYKLFRNIMNK
ncbi:MAG: hypothetical protein NC177_06245 [Ruminococcus flavefaciens]|nr:hypothetical protein [Ruminococcus flavefaciens]